MSRRSRSFNAFEQATTAAIDDAVTSIPLDSVANLTPPGYLVIDPDNPLLREYIFYTEINALVLDNVSRGLEGSAGGIAQEHSSGARVRAVSVHQWLNDIFDDIEDLEALQGNYLLLDGSRPMVGNLDMGSTNRIVDLANGLADQDAATLKQVTDGDLLLLPLDGSRAMTGDLDMGAQDILNVNRLLFADGLVGTPSVTFTTEPDTGLYLKGTAPAILGVAVDGADLIEVHSNKSVFNTGVEVPAGSATRKSTISNIRVDIGQDQDAGSGGRISSLDFHAGGANDYDVRFQASEGVIGSIGEGVLNIQALRTTYNTEVEFSGNPVSMNNGLGSGGGRLNMDAGEIHDADLLYAKSGGTGFLGFVGVAWNRLYNNDFYAQDGTLAMQTVAGGVVAISNPPVGTVANVQMSGSNILQKITSAARYKTDIEPAPELADLSLRPVSFVHLGDGLKHIGFVADEVAEMDVRAGMFDDEGVIENYDIRGVVAVLAAKVNRLEAAQV